MGNDNCAGKREKHSADDFAMGKYASKNSLNNSMPASQMLYSSSDVFPVSAAAASQKNQDDPDTDDDDDFLSQPMQNYESFERYLAHLNKKLQENMPFLRAKFGVTAIEIMMALSDGGILTESLKKKWFDKGCSKTTILVQFTKVGEKLKEDDGDGLDDEWADTEMINIRKFRSVKKFMKRVDSLDTALNAIESFTDEVRQLKMFTPGGDPEDACASASN